MLNINHRLRHAAHHASVLQHPALRRSPVSAGRVLAQLREVEASVVRNNTTTHHFVIPSAANSTKIQLYKALGLTIQCQTVPVKKDP
ncbi:MAG: hypothetical protein OXL40_09735 [Bacteroidota bacterium]|nr:hypothetical protein [Bacteroidota bacterium]